MMKTPWQLFALLLIGLSLAACAEHRSEADTGIPAEITFVRGSDFPRVTLSKAASERRGIQTAPVEAVPEDLLPYEPFNYGNFTDPINFENDWLPLQPGRQWIHEGINLEDGERTPHRIEFTVTDLVKTIDGVPAIVAWIVDIADGQIVEKEIAFFAEDDDHTIWLLGEHPEEFEDGEFQAAPTWIAGTQSARAGIAMPANPQLGTPDYAQGWAPAVDWTDRAKLWKTGQTATVAAGTFTDVLIVDEFNRSEPDIKTKSYAKGIGLVEVGWRGVPFDSSEELELVELNQLDPDALTAIREEALSLDQHAYEVNRDTYGHTNPVQPLSLAGPDRTTDRPAINMITPYAALPESAVVYGLHGETWLYALVEDTPSYERQPITVEEISDGMAILSSGPPLGTQIVVAGSMTLYGMENLIEK
ncbi:MAG: hypothetical protein ACE5Q6_04060 [Dehalococcoidia bacterium]